MQYADCPPCYPLWWCQHGAPTYDNTNHGWPFLASHAIATFFATIKVPPANEPPNLITDGSVDSTNTPWQGDLMPPASGSVRVQAQLQGGGPAARSVPVTFCIDDVQVSAW
jgi:hypothetical protein